MISFPTIVLVSWYLATGNPTATGATYRPERLTCAADKWPAGTLLTLETADHREVTVLVNDRLGPDARRLHREIDLTPAAFFHLAPLTRGITLVKVTKISWPIPDPAH